MFFAAEISSSQELLKDLESIWNHEHYLRLMRGSQSAMVSDSGPEHNVQRLKRGVAG